MTKTEATTISKKLTSKEVGIVHGFRSGLEETISSQLERAGHPVVFEQLGVPYRVEKSCTYTPDFILANGIVIETKGRFVTADRQKHLMIQKQYPDLDIRFVFSRATSRISKTSRTTYAAWCAAKCFRHADKAIPRAWLEERENRASLTALRDLFDAQDKDWPF